MDIEKYFEELRFDKNHHLGLGDIRITIAQQEEIIAEIQRLKKRVNSLRYDNKKLRQMYVLETLDPGKFYS